MTAEVVDLSRVREERAPTLTGSARCLAFGHDWVAAAPIGLEWLECPTCRLVRGRFVYPVQRGGEEWACNCGCTLFKVNRVGIYCPNCGADQRFP